MSPQELERYLHEHIPISAAMQVHAAFVGDDAVVLGAPLGPNINHRETVFGGSASALAILAAWALLHVRLRGVGQTCRLVIQRNTVEYERPIQGAFSARATLEEPQAWPRFLGMLHRAGRARISACAVLESDGLVVGHFSGAFVALAE